MYIETKIQFDIIFRQGRKNIQTVYTYTPEDDFNI